jgi:hypothetical protein
MYFLHFSPSSENDGIFFAASFSQADNTAVFTEIIMSHTNWLKSRVWVAAVTLLGLCWLLVGGCASTVVQAQWADPQFAGRSLRGATALVVCNASAVAI